jgi:hypothetical protein
VALTDGAVMDNSTDRQFDKADAAVDQAGATFIGKVESMRWRWQAVSSQYIVERVALALCDEIVKLIDDPNFAGSTSSEMLKLSNALADFRDSRR